MSPQWHATIDGVDLRPLQTHADDRGALTELLRHSWIEGAPRPVQFNYVRSEANVLRGMHLHVTHWDFLIVPEGEATIALVDLRRGSGSARNARMLRMRGDAMSLLTIPPGVAHGFHFRGRGVFLYGLSHYWDPVNDEIACRWDDPRLDLDWQIDGAPLLSAKDEDAGTLDEMIAKAGGMLS